MREWGKGSHLVSHTRAGSLQAANMPSSNSRICVYVQTLPGQGVFADVFKLKTLRWEMNLGHPSDLMSSQVSYKREEGGS